MAIDFANLHIFYDIATTNAANFSRYLPYTFSEAAISSFTCIKKSDAHFDQSVASDFCMK